VISPFANLGLDRIFVAFPPSKKNMAEKPSDFDQGSSIGNILKSGHALEAKSAYDRLQHQIQDETKDAPSMGTSRLVDVQRGIAEVDPTDVEKLSGKDHPGYYIYWNARDVATRTLALVDDFCSSHNNCEGVGNRSNGHYDKEHQPPAPRSEVNATTMDIEKFIADTNKWLQTELPDQLEYQVFIHDFNQKRFYPDLVADKSETFHAILKTTPLIEFHREYVPE
jgi:hypothetical protein